MTISAEKIEAYRDGLWRRLSRPLTKNERDVLDRAYAEARQLAQQLANEYDVKRILLFGSVARRRPLRSNSDVDLAVEGMTTDVYYKIVGDLQTESGRAVDLIRIENLRPAMKRIVLSEGIILVDDGNREYPTSDN